MDTATNLLDTLGSTSPALHGSLDVSLILTALGAALASALGAMLLYRLFYAQRGTGSQLQRSFPLLAVSITALFIGIQVSIPLSLGLLGSLSIIRFRTPVKDPEEIGFLMLVIASSIAAATFQFAFMGYLFAFAVAGLLILRGIAALHRVQRDGILVVTLPTWEAAKLPAVEEYLKKSFRSYRLESSADREDNTTFQYAFTGLRPSTADFNAGLRELASFRSIHLVMDRPGGIR